MKILPSPKEWNIKGKRVILRADWNVPVEGNKLGEDYRIRRSFATIDYLRKKKARIIVMSHIGKDGRSSLRPVVEYLEKRMAVGFVPDFRSEEAHGIVRDMKEGSVVVFENLRQDSREEKNDPAFAKLLASFGDYYINDAFSASHRAHASIVGIPKLLPSAFGFLFLDEIKHLSLALKPTHPFVFVVGGAKVSTKMPLMKKFARLADTVFVGGALANNFFKEEGMEVGKSFIEKGTFGLRPLFKKKSIILPSDVVVRDSSGTPQTREISAIMKRDAIMDAGPSTLRALGEKIARAKLIVWNGPLGNYEAGFDAGTITLLKLLAKARGKTILGGGDTIALVDRLKMEGAFTFISTGGGAMLDYLVDGKLDGIDAIMKKARRSKK
ncbi:MAG: phosphoglycerate kinase [Candidatus Yonathbacteria bacterium RIFCSPHIGHO2_01_FULL_51_10]|uniref:Phosphoglycerate kinase n=1 Tax=Candidatus Yonathbacteria bacterium RIFCSPHIGHO2_01_FULL_51_10 TaxID=1802723 RepID=A0A1G2SBU1_9BACT|nr:MAG: phosphoglycerate kinase [Candidatus Yonathbacteria bacterium RIFCSPHIGHO2_01_FULL_51_10]